MTKLSHKQAAERACRDCRNDDDKSRKTASFLAKQHLIASGFDQSEAAAAMPEVEKHLDKLFEKRRDKSSSKKVLTPTIKPTITPTITAADDVDE